MEPRIELRIILIPAVATLLAVSANAAEVYRWVDENGEVHYSETLPPDHVDKGHDVLNERGIVLNEDQKLTPPPPKEKPEKGVKGEKGEEELPRDSSGMKRPKPLYSEAEMQRRMDNFLMLRYDSEREIDDAMNIEIKQLDYDRRLLETTRDSMLQSYRGRIRQAANMQRAGHQVGDETTREITSLQIKLADNQRDLDSLQQREDEIRAEFRKQLDRFRYLFEVMAEEEETGS